MLSPAQQDSIDDDLRDSMSLLFTLVWGTSHFSKFAKIRWSQIQKAHRTGTTLGTWFYLTPIVPQNGGRALEETASLITLSASKGLLSEFLVTFC